MASLQGLIAGVVSVAVVAGACWFLGYLKARRLKKARALHTAQNFAAYFSIDLVPEALSLQVYDYLQRLMNIRHFPVMPSDSLSTIYGIGRFGGLALSEVVDDLIGFCGCREPRREEMEGAEPIATVEDLVRFLSRFYGETRQ